MWPSWGLQPLRKGQFEGQASPDFLVMLGIQEEMRGDKDWGPAGAALVQKMIGGMDAHSREVRAGSQGLVRKKRGMGKDGAWRAAPNLSAPVVLGQV